MTEAEAQERFTALYAEYYPRVYAYLVSRAGREIAEEAASQTSWLPGAGSLTCPRPSCPGCSEWLATFSASRTGTVSGLPGWSANSANEPASPPPDPAEDIAGRADVLNALAALADSDREVLTLISWHDLTTREAAKVVGCSPATFLVRLHRARRRLAAALDRPLSAPRTTEWSSR